MSAHLPVGFTRASRTAKRMVLECIIASPTTAREISETIGLSYQQVSKYLRVLVMQGTVTVTHCDGSRRVHAVKDMPKAVAAVAIAESPVLEHIPTNGIMTHWVGGNPFMKAMA